jgi:hypothetical protein
MVTEWHNVLYAAGVVVPPIQRKQLMKAVSELGCTLCEYFSLSLYLGQKVIAAFCIIFFRVGCGGTVSEIRKQIYRYSSLYMCLKNVISI